MNLRITSYPELARFSILARREIAVAAIRKYANKSLFRTLCTIALLPFIAFAFIWLFPPRAVPLNVYATGLVVVLVLVLLVQILFEVNGPYRVAVCRYLAEAENTSSDPLELALNGPTAVEAFVLQTLLANSTWPPDTLLRSMKKAERLMVVGFILALPVAFKILLGNLVSPMWLVLAGLSGALSAYYFAQYASCAIMFTWLKYLNQDAINHRLLEINAGKKKDDTEQLKRS